MTRRLTPKFAPYAALAAAGLLAALATRLPELVALAAPFALLPAVSLLLARSPSVGVEVAVERERALEGDELELVVSLVSAVGADRLDVFVELPRDVALLEGENPSTIRLRDNQTRELRYRLGCTRWGAFRLGRVFFRRPSRGVEGLSA